MSAGKTILLVDASEAVRAYFDTVLSEKGYSVALAGSADEGLKKLKQRLPDLIILDWDLPDLDGRQFCTLLKNDAELRYIPIIMCTMHKTTEEKISGLKLGADDYISKPFDEGELLERINALFRRIAMSAEQSQVKLLATHQESFSSSLAASSGAVERDARAAIKDLGLTIKMRHGPLFVWNLLDAPIETFSKFEAIKTPTALLPIAFICAFKIVEAMLSVQNSSFIRGPLAAAIIPALFLSAIAALLAMALRDHRANFKAMASLCAMSAAPLALSNGLRLTYVLVTGGTPSEFTASPLLLLARVPPLSFAGLVLDRFDLFEIWAACLLAFGCARLFAHPPKRAMTLAVGAWTFLSAGQLAGILAFSAK